MWVWMGVSFEVRRLALGQFDVCGKPLVPSEHQSEGTRAIERKVVAAEITAIAIEETEAGGRLWHAAVLIRDKKQVGVLDEERMFDVDGKRAVRHCWNPKLHEPPRRCGGGDRPDAGLSHLPTSTPD
jgi:hypothetical protein